MLGMGDMQGLMETIQDMALSNPDKHKEMAKKLEEGKLSIRDWREQISNVMNMGPISKLASMIPGLPAELLQGGDEEGSRRMKRMLFITDSMTAAELDSDGMIFLDKGADGTPTALSPRVLRIAKGSGTNVREVEEMLTQYRMMANMAKSAGGKNGWMSAIQKMQQAAGPPRGPNGMPTQQQIAEMRRALPPGMLQNLQRMRQGGGGIQDMMRSMMGGANADPQELAEMEEMMAQMSRGGGMPGMGGGMPDMSSMMRMMGMGGMGGR
ncbi:Signal recognition particle [Ceratobasidium sp. 428]|nr:Signal recognition particle [Ceratobasidium sp. 428]